ncbi:MAG: DUF177 domain-containing protein [Syntrophaceae bacterium]|nr:DUF177 domain-containing protein [Syntrophaceae bacterium]
MKIDVSKIPEGGMDLRFERDGQWFLERLPETEPPDFKLGKISMVCTAWRMKENVFIEGTAETVVEAPCSRCLERSRVPVAARFKYTFAPPAGGARKELELSTEDLDFAACEEDTVDLGALLFEQILLQVPVKPLCREKCRGLCPSCGTNLNMADCACENEVLDERLAILKHFKVQPKKPYTKKEG